MSQVTILDGGFATQLCAHVDQPVDGTPLWSASFLATHPQACIDTHMDFLRAGATVISTNTYQASIEGFVEHLNLSEVESLNLIRSAVDLAKQACQRYLEEIDTGAPKLLVAGSVGPYGATQNDGSEYTGDYVDCLSKQELMDWHRPRIQILVEEGVDFLAFDTVPAQIEGEALVELLKEFPQQKAWLSFSCKDGKHLCHGEQFQQAVWSCWEKNCTQLVAVGTNCVNPKFVSPLFKGINMKRSISIPLVVYPNSGENYDVKFGWSEGEKCEPLESYVQEWLDLGVRYIGGCCRTYPENIINIRAEVDKYMASKMPVKPQKT